MINPFFRLFRGAHTLSQRVFNIVNGDSFLLIMTNFVNYSLPRDLKLFITLPFTTNFVVEIFPLQEDLAILENLDPEAWTNMEWLPNNEMDLAIQDLENFDMGDFPDFIPNYDLDEIIRGLDIV